MVRRDTPSFYSSFVADLLMRQGDADSLFGSHDHQVLVPEQQPNRPMPVSLPHYVPSKKRGVGRPISSPLHRDL
jgi:hypothetical protein